MTSSNIHYRKDIIREVAVVQQNIKYFVTGHTKDGFVNFLSSNLVEINHIYVLEHPSNIVKTKLLQKLIALYHENQQPIEMIRSSESEHYLEGIIIRSMSVAYVSDQIVDMSLSNVTKVPLRKYIKSSQQEKLKSDNEQEIKRLKAESYNLFKESYDIHEKLEDVFINEMDFQKADKIADKTIEMLFQNVKSLEREAHVYKRLFATNTPDGFLNYLEPLIESMEKRIFIKGRAGTGKSFFMNQILNECTTRGLDVELYHCSFDPKSIDMLIIRQLNVCLFDSTPPHELFPNRSTDEVIDFYEKTVTPGTDEKYAEQIYDLTKNYKAKMKAGLEKLREVKPLEDEREQVWKGVYEEEINTVAKKIIKK